MKPVVVVETAPFIRHVADLLSDPERQEFIDYLARNPDAGDLVKGTGGARKVRWARDGGGKSGGIRTIYCYHAPDAPLFLLTVYGKGEKASLSDRDKRAIHAAIDILKAAIRACRGVVAND